MKSGTLVILVTLFSLLSQAQSFGQILFFNDQDFNPETPKSLVFILDRKTTYNYSTEKIATGFARGFRFEDPNLFWYGLARIHVLSGFLNPPFKDAVWLPPLEDYKTEVLSLIQDEKQVKYEFPEQGTQFNAPSGTGYVVFVSGVQVKYIESFFVTQGNGKIYTPVYSLNYFIYEVSSGKLITIGHAQDKLSKKLQLYSLATDEFKLLGKILAGEMQLFLKRISGNNQKKS